MAAKSTTIVRSNQLDVSSLAFDRPVRRDDRLQLDMNINGGPLYIHTPRAEIVADAQGKLAIRAGDDLLQLFGRLHEAAADTLKANAEEYFGKRFSPKRIEESTVRAADGESVRFKVAPDCRMQNQFGAPVSREALTSGAEVSALLHVECVEVYKRHWEVSVVAVQLKAYVSAAPLDWELDATKVDAISEDTANAIKDAEPQVFQDDDDFFP
jgi:hypothetical protein